MKKAKKDESKNFKLSYEFYSFCRAHPELRFWQALYEWSRSVLILVDGEDPFYWITKKNEDGNSKKRKEK